MTLAKTLMIAAIFGGLAQSGVKPSPSVRDQSDAAIVETAENLTGLINSNVVTGLEATAKSREITSKNLSGVIALLDSCTSRLRENGLQDRLKRAGQKAQMVQTQALAVLKDPGNKEVLSRDLQPDEYRSKINFQKASLTILDQKIQRLRQTVDEMQKYSAMLGGVLPPEQLSDRLRVRMNQLLSEWNFQGDTKDRLQQPHLSEAYHPTQNVQPDGPPSVSLSFSLGKNRVKIERGNDGIQSELSKPATKVLSMTKQKTQEKAILKYIRNSEEPFQIGSADRILKLRDLGVSGPVISAMLRRDEQLR